MIQHTYNKTSIRTSDLDPRLLFETWFLLKYQGNALFL